MSTARNRETEPDEPHGSKRLRTHSLRGKFERCCGYERIEGAYFPARILDLPHVLAQMDSLLMTPEEAITEAAGSGDVVWLRQFLQSYKIHIPYALVPAAANDHLECVEVLLNEFSEAKIWKALKQAVGAAGANNNVNVLRRLWEAFNPTKFGGVNTCIAVKQVFDDAAGRGHLGVVKFIAQDAVTANYDMNPSSALRLAIAERHTDVVEFLFGLDGSWWYWGDVLITAVATGQHAFADRAIKMYREMRKDKPFLVLLTQYEGGIDAIKYLHSHGENDTKVVSEAFVSAAKSGFTATVEFLLGTNQLLPGTFDKALVIAATYSRKNILTLEFLCGKARATQQAIDKAFTSTDHSMAVKFLYENERVSGKAIVAAFKNASGWGKRCINFCYNANRTEITKALCKDSCIPGEVVGRALVHAAFRGQAIEIVALLRNDTRISAELKGEAFAAAAMSDSRALIKSTCSWSLQSTTSSTGSSLKLTM